MHPFYAEKKGRSLWHRSAFRCSCEALNLGFCCIVVSMFVLYTSSRLLQYHIEWIICIWVNWNIHKISLKQLFRCQTCFPNLCHYMNNIEFVGLNQYTMFSITCHFRPRFTFSACLHTTWICTTSPGNGNMPGPVWTKELPCWWVNVFDIWVMMETNC